MSPAPFLMSWVGSILGAQAAARSGVNIVRGVVSDSWSGTCSSRDMITVFFIDPTFDGEKEITLLFERDNKRLLKPLIKVGKMVEILFSDGEITGIRNPENTPDSWHWVDNDVISIDRFHDSITEDWY